MGIFSKLKQAFSGKSDSDRYLSGLNKSRKSFSEKIRRLSLNFTGVNEEFLEELMIVLLEADIGIHTAQKIVDEVENRAMDQKLKTFAQINECLVEVMADMYQSKEDKPFTYNPDGPTVILMVGVNGSGKTTTTAKLSKLFLDEGKSVAVAAADTFRAGAVDQLETWADRLNIPCIKGRENGDPSATLVDACRYAKENKIDVLIGDTAGRLQNKTNLMNELSKMKRVVEREIPGAPHEVWLVIDATTGQNGISQAELFMEASDVTGILLTKLDGTAKGGIVIAIRDRLGLPVKYIGLGERVDDLRPFDLDSYLYGLCEGIEEKLMIDKTQLMNDYLDWYEDLLTAKQKEICSLYYKEDYSLAEISENYNISRSAVLDTLKRSEKLLEDYEEKLQLVKKFHARVEIYGKIKEFGNDEINSLVKNLEEID